MKKYVIKHEREECIGCSNCENMASGIWKLNNDGKVDLIKNEIGEEELKKMIEVAEYCPVGIINITEKDTKKKIC